MIKNLPNILTISRILVIPLIIVCFMLASKLKIGYFVSALLFVAAAITDFFDGYFARTWSMYSKLGKILDPIADKLLVVSCITILVGAGRADILPSIAIICREILVSGLREFLSELKLEVPVGKLAKIKTTVQMIAIPLLLWGSEGSGIKYVDEIGNIVLWIASLLTLITGYAYFKASIKHINK